MPSQLRIIVWARGMESSFGRYSGSAPNAVCYAFLDTADSVEEIPHAVGDATPQDRPLVGACAAGAARALSVARRWRGPRDAGRDVLARGAGHRGRRGAIRAR